MATTTKIYLDDAGTQIVLDSGQNISAATLLEIHYLKPSGETGVWTATLSGTNYLKYETLKGDLDESGTWKLQAYIEIPGWKGHGETIDIEVYAQFDIIKEDL